VLSGRTSFDTTWACDPPSTWHLHTHAHCTQRYLSTSLCHSLCLKLGKSGQLSKSRLLYPQKQVSHIHRKSLINLTHLHTHTRKHTRLNTHTNPDDIKLDAQNSATSTYAARMGWTIDVSGTYVITHAYEWLMSHKWNKTCLCSKRHFVRANGVWWYLHYL